MYATLVGTNTGNASVHALLARLQEVATQAGFAPPDAPLRVRPDGPMDGWQIEQLGPYDERADFMLSVLAPRVLGVSPIYPVYKTVSGPLFAVVVLPSVYGISRDDRRDFYEVASEDSICEDFGDFLSGLQTGSKYAA